MVCGGATAKADVMLFQKLFAIIYALLTKASAFPQRVRLSMQRTVFVGINTFRTFSYSALAVPETCVLRTYTDVLVGFSHLLFLSAGACVKKLKLGSVRALASVAMKSTNTEKGGKTDEMFLFVSCAKVKPLFLHVVWKFLDNRPNTSGGIQI